MTTEISAGPWKTDRWFVSPWNFQPESRQELEFPAKVIINDVTLRDGEQQAGIEFTKDDKIRIADALAEAGVPRIEAGFPGVYTSDYEALKEIAHRNLSAEIFSFARCRIDDVKMAVDCGVKGVIVEIPSSQHIISEAYRWPLERAIELSIEATLYAKSQGLYTVFFPIDASRSEITWYLDVIEQVAKDGHMDALALVDTFGVLTPQAVRFFAKRTRERIKVPLETHFHMDFGLGVANTIAAIASGAEVMHLSVTGTGERAGNTPLEDTVMALLTLYGVDLGIQTEKLYGLSKMVREMAGLEVPSNRQIVGDQLFWVESGIITGWYRNLRESGNLTEMFPYLPEVVGQSGVEIVLGKGSGIDSVALWLEKLGIEAPDGEMREMLMEVKAKSLEKKGLLTDEEFHKIATGVATKPRA
jgi:isopropylmalate/homocitrate/citramalate synthase